MSDIVIRIENLGKRYRYGGAAPLSYNLRQDVADWAKGLFRRNSKRHATLQEVHEKHISESPEYFWALKNVNLEINRGDVVGIIGRNGAGKSTLLKILSRITPPTTGTITLYGRVASLLEVGTGFHRELTGRENIFLNGSILGMRRVEISGKLDEIVAFAEIDKFIDTPVKFYSSGMYVRLAFAVAAHLEPEILIVDEVLAVGDAAFQKKCLGKMSEVAKQGRTVLFVSHNMAAIEALCPSCILFENGRLKETGTSSVVVGKYLDGSGALGIGTVDLISHPGRTTDSTPIMRKVSLLSEGVELTAGLRMAKSLSFKVEFASSEYVSPVLGVAIKSAQGLALFGVNNRFIPGYRFADKVRSGSISCHLANPPLMPGRYIADLYFGDYRADLDVVLEAAAFEVLPSDVFLSGRLPPPSAGPIFLPASWTLDSFP